jgi:hypothetical protein
MSDTRSLAKRTADLAIHLSNPDDRATAHEAARVIAQYEQAMVNMADKLQWPKKWNPQTEKYE